MSAHIDGETTRLLREANLYSGLRNPVFDRWLIAGVPVVALTSLAITLLWPSTLYLVLTIDLWLLGYHHVIATYTRIGFDRESLSKHWKLLVLLPVAVAAAVYLVGIAGGPGVLTTIYFYWLWFHYVRQAEGVSKAYAARSGSRQIADIALHRASFYAMPTAALLQVASFSNGNLLGIEIQMLTIPSQAMILIWFVVATLAIASLYQLHAMVKRKQLSTRYLMFVYSHYGMFIATYGLVNDLTTAWLGLNVWHNLQYLTFVWLSHQRRFHGKIDPKALVLSTIAKPGNLVIYVSACLAITFVFYMGALNFLTPIGATLGTTSVLTAVMLYQTINFHHYVVDAVIWRRPKAGPTPKTTPDPAST